MGYIPSDTEWYIAEVVMEITVDGASRNSVHRNIVLINARLPQDAYAKAVQIGNKSETHYDNLKGQLVKIRFRGVSKLDAVYEPLEDGAELAFEEQLAGC